ncbi:MAG: 1-acyl-sn-glycerol-3-phosphate acyltransferase [Mediterranea sp.]|nr:1-acyl-sn-glycerol-3-phosphate acyltransferase [Mediterranea sp.]
MTQFFIRLYNYFERHQILFYLSLACCVLFMGFFAVQVKFEENVTRFFPDTPNAQNTAKVFDNLKVKDKIAVMLLSRDSTAVLPTDSLIMAADQLQQELTAKAGGTLIKDILVQVDQNLVGEATDFVYQHLPLFLTEADYARFDSLLTSQGIRKALQKDYHLLLSPAGVAMKEYLLRDPLGLAGNALKHLQDFQVEANYQIRENHIFAQDGSTLLLFITPVYGTGSTGKNGELITLIETSIRELERLHPALRIEYFGGPSVSVYNARQIKKDTLLTSTIALCIIIAFISLVFKRKRSIPLIIAPVLFGGLFALCIIFFIRGSISAIAVGAGSAVLGIAISYSIHILAHQNHVTTIQQLIKELTYPLTIGSFTTIGAFLGLLFTSSDLLKDFGLFASLTLIGTTLFCLVYLPHFLTPQANIKQGWLLRLIEKCNAYPYEKNRWLVGGILLLTLVCLFTSQKVGFNDNMMALNYDPPQLRQAEQRLMEIWGTHEKTVLFVSVGKEMQGATAAYARTNRTLDSLKAKGWIKGYASATRFLIPSEEQERRLQRWNSYWTDAKRKEVSQEVEAAAAENHFRPASFNRFYQWLDTPFGLYHYDTGSSKLLEEWQSSADSLTMLISQVRVNEVDKEQVYRHFAKDREVVIFDRSFFTNKWVSAINNDFYLILYLSSILIFLALWVSYGRIELTLISFLPMLVSWVIILGLMGMLGIEFNIVNIILSTFIFGIGDDFSIFIMDGLQNKYRTGQTVLNSHKTAIFFSAFTTVVGMGTLVFARHPALQSISLISILGMGAVVLVAYTIQPLIFRLFISGPAEKGLPPYTAIGLLRTILLFSLFFIGCLLLRLFIALLYLVPVRRSRKQRWVCRLIRVTCQGILVLGTYIQKEIVNPTGERFERPAILIANHQSFIDILVLLSLSSKVVMVTNHWVWRSPFFGAIIRYAGFYCIDEGYEHYIDRMREKVKEGYTIAVFPEGTRTLNGRMKRFHKGAFYIAEQLRLDILPIVLYGNDKIIAKAQPFNIRKGIIYAEILPRILVTDPSFGHTYQERTKRIAAYMRQEYERIYRAHATTDNPAYHEALVQNYIYKGPIVEWYIRVKVRMEHNYRRFDELIPAEGRITDIGCGYGPLCYMLALTSERREILGIDYDAQKIAVAQHGWLRQERLQFRQGDALEYPLPESDVFVLSDMLHYLSDERQFALLRRCAALLRPHGLIILRDGNAEETEKHRLTRLTELFSTRVFRFNRTAEPLHFTSESRLREMVGACGLSVTALPNDKYTSNTFYIIRREENDPS